MSEGTPIETRSDILADFWINYKSSDNFQEFIQYNDLGLPLAYAASAGLIKLTPESTGFVDETFDLLLEAIGIQDEGFENLDDILFRYDQ
jgi:hypothetical protein